MKPWQTHTIVGLTALLAGIGYGRFLTPDKVVTVDHSEELQTLRQQVASLTAENTSLKRHTVKKSVTKFADGKPVERTDTEDTHVDRQTATLTDVKINTDATAARLTDHTQTVESKRPDWRVSALLGFDLATRAPVYGGEVSRRLLGSFWLGAWGTTSGGLPAIGGSLSFEF